MKGPFLRTLNLEVYLNNAKQVDEALLIMFRIRRYTHDFEITPGEQTIS